MHLNLSVPGLQEAIDAYLNERAAYHNQGFHDIDYRQTLIARVLLDALRIPSNYPHPDEWKEWPRDPNSKPKPKKQPDQGFVYLMHNKRNGFYKIGWSKNPNMRENTLQAQEPEIAMVNNWKTTRDVERFLHNQFAGYRLRGEWFKLDEEHVAFIENFFKDKLQATN